MNDEEVKEIFDNLDSLFKSMSINQEALIDLLKKQKQQDSFCICRMCKCFSTQHTYTKSISIFSKGVWAICVRHAPSQGISFKETEKWFAGRILPQVHSTGACFEGRIDPRKEVLYRRFDNILNYEWIKKEKEVNIEEYKPDRQKHEKQNIMLAIFRQEGNILNRKFN